MPGHKRQIPLRQTLALSRVLRHSNNNGKLECAGGEKAAGPGQPAGSYTETCRNIHMKGTTLHADCKSLDGRELPTSLKDPNSCAEGVANINGILNCESSGVLPPGSYITP